MRFILGGMLLLASIAAGNAEDLCPDIDKQPVQQGSRILEETLEVPAGLDAADKLSEFLNKQALTYDFGQVVNAFVIKGVILRQQALGGRLALDLAKARQQAGAMTSGDVAKAEIAAKKGLDAFCGYMLIAVIAE